MTGFASVDVEHPMVVLSVTLRSVNHRHLDLHVRLPSPLLALESLLRSQVQQQLARGRVELNVSAQFVQRANLEVEVNEALVERLSEALNRVRASGLSIADLTAGDLLHLPHAIDVRETAGDSEVAAQPDVIEVVTGAVAQALDELVTMRSTEGEYLLADLDARCALVSELIAKLETSAAHAQGVLEARLGERLKQLVGESELDQGMVAQEIVKFVARSDINEEIVRLKGHMVHWRTIVDDSLACGRRLDFLLQEMNREINTIGSKAEGLEVSKLIVSAKADLERLREQVQNVE
ncbi:MAG: YicC/YloC family endoribonuclease [Acidobacteriota bacterium]|nr:YicC/YloC family endoribonuclease [Acidobacteriota bacterium]